MRLCTILHANATTLSRSSQVGPQLLTPPLPRLRARRSSGTGNDSVGLIAKRDPRFGENASQMLNADLAHYALPDQRGA